MGQGPMEGTTLMLHQQLGSTYLILSRELLNRVL